MTKEEILFRKNFRKAAGELVNYINECCGSGSSDNIKNESQVIEFNTRNIQGKFIGQKQCENLLSSLLNGCKTKVKVFPWLETNPITNKPSLIGFKLKINF